MAQPTDDKLHEDLIKAGYTQSLTNPNKYVGLDDNNRPDNIWTDKDRYQKQDESTSTWKKYELWRQRRVRRKQNAGTLLSLSAIRLQLFTIQI